jgi:hypothetical protein
LEHSTEKAVRFFGTLKAPGTALRTLRETAGMTKFEGAAMMVIDVQRAIDAPYHAADGPRNHPRAEPGSPTCWRCGVEGGGR